MSAAKRGSYPHPVLDGSDDIDSTFQVLNVTIAPTVDDVEIRFQVRMDDPDIQKLIDAGDARLSFRWKCGPTFSSEELEPRQAPTGDGTNYLAYIDQQKIRRSVQVDIKVVAIRVIHGYKLERQHQDYGGARFDISPGDVLADAGSFTFEADKLYDPLNPPVGSCFRFIENRTLSKGLKITWDNDEYVTVAFPDSSLTGLAALGSRPDLQISLVVLPALMATIEYIKNNASSENDEDLSEKLWCRAITQLIDSSGGMDKQTFELAQKILNNPLDLTLTKPLINDEDDE